MNPKELFKNYLKKRGELLEKTEIMEESFAKSCELIASTLKSGGKILIAGNGGSASQASHFSAELVWRFKKHDRRPLPVINLVSDVSTVTAISNDAGYEYSIEVQIDAFGQEGDIFIALSTSGKSKNILNALQKARKKRIKTILLTGMRASDNIADVVINVPSDETPLVQECHLFLIHALCEFIDEIVGG